MIRTSVLQFTLPVVYPSTDRQHARTLTSGSILQRSATVCSTLQQHFAATDRCASVFFPQNNCSSTKFLCGSSSSNKESKGRSSIQTMPHRPPADKCVATRSGASAVLVPAKHLPPVEPVPSLPAGRAREGSYRCYTEYQKDGQASRQCRTAHRLINA